MSYPVPVTGLVKRACMNVQEELLYYPVSALVTALVSALA